MASAVAVSTGLVVLEVVAAGATIVGVVVEGGAGRVVGVVGGVEAPRTGAGTRTEAGARRDEPLAARAAASAATSRATSPISARFTVRIVTLGRADRGPPRAGARLQATLVSSLLLRRDR